MSRTAPQILTEALALPEQERLQLASEILASVEGPGDPDWDRLWLEELDRRAAAADRGELALEEWADVRKRVLARLGPR